MADALAWLSILGIGEDGLDGLNPVARQRLTEAALVIGGQRHLDLAQPLIQGESQVWPTPLGDIAATLLAWKPKPVCVLASGDPFTYGIGATLARSIPANEMLVLPAASAFSLAAARLGWALQDTITLGLNSRPLPHLLPHLQPGARLIALCRDAGTPAAIAALLCDHGWQDAQLTVLERLGGPHERISQTTAAGFALEDIAALNCVALALPADAASHRRALPRGFGLADDLFEHDGQLTKREIRAVTLSSLAPRRGELLWDIGLGAGSVAIEWLLADPANQAIGLERDAERAARARRNALRLGVPHLRVIEAEAPAGLDDLPAPDAIFIGGGGAAPGLIELLWQRLRPGGRLVANAVTLETEAALLAAYQRWGGQLIRLGLERASPVGGVTGWRPAMPVLHWSLDK